MSGSNRKNSNSSRARAMRLTGSLAGALASVLAAGMLSAPAADASTGTLQYTCSGPGFGTASSYAFTAVVDSDLPATLPFGSQYTASTTTTITAPESFRSWAVSQGYTVLYAGAILGTAVDGVAQPATYQPTPAIAVPLAGTWTWTTEPTSMEVSATTLGHHTYAVTSLDITVAFHDANGPRLATTATCVVDSSAPTYDPTIDSWDVVATTATSTTSLSLKGDTATAIIVTSDGTAAVGVVEFSAGENSVTVPVVSGQATVRLPKFSPGACTVTATFVPDETSQLTGSTATATRSKSSHC